MLNHFSKIQTISLPLSREEDWKVSLPNKVKGLDEGLVVLNCRDWLLTYRDFQKIEALCGTKGLQIEIIISTRTETIVSASSLGYQAKLSLNNNQKKPTNSEIDSNNNHNDLPLLFHRGTIRSGENLDSEGDILLLGDVNPGAKISAVGNILIWGKLRGNAHAGKLGDDQAKIIALQLRPLQLRISQAIARGPEEKPQAGFAEEAILESGQIVIKPANPNLLRAHTAQNVFIS